MATRASFYRYNGLILTFLVAVFIHYPIIKYSGLNLGAFQASPQTFFGALLLSFATAISEETVFRGYIFNRLLKIWKNEWLANLVSSLLFSFIHLPIAVFGLSYTPPAMGVYLFLVLTYGIGAAFAFARTGNIVSAILLHIFWAWPVILFK